MPPNWETRFDNSSRRWFYINHSTKSTTWEDPRPSYYASASSKVTESANNTSRRERSRLSCDHGLSTESPSTSESPYSLPDADDERNRPQVDSPKEADADGTEDGEVEAQDFMSYLNALRASYPDLKERQLAQLLEDFLGDSPELRKFVSSHLRRNLSERSSEKQKSKSTHSHSGQSRGASYGLDRLKSPSNAAATQSMQLHASDFPRSAEKVIKSRVSEPWRDIGAMPPCSEQEEITTTTEVESEKDVNPTQHVRIGNHVSTRILKPSEPASQLPASCVVHSVDAKKEEDSTRTETPITEAKGLQCSLSTKQHVVHRITPRGPDPSIRVQRVKPSGHNPELAKGPNRHLVSGSLSMRPRDRERC